MEPLTSLEPHLDAWRRAGLIDADQAAAIRRFEAARRPEASGAGALTAQRSGGDGVRDRMAATIGIVGGLVLGLGVLLSVAANWDSIGDAVKVGLVCAALLAAYGGGAVADRRAAPRWAGSAGYVVGALTFAGGVFLVGQVFHVRAHDPLGFLVAAIAASAVAVVTSRRVVGAVAAAAWLAWGGYELAWRLDATQSFGSAVSAVGAGTLLVLAAYGCGWILEGLAHRARSTGSGEPSLGRTLVGDLDAVGVPLRAVSLVALAGLLVPLSFGWHAEDEPLGGGVGVPVLAAFALVALVAFGVARRAPVERRTTLAAAIAIAAGMVVLAAIVGSMVVTAVLANLLLLLGGFGLCALGLVERLHGSFNAGVAWLVLLVAARYVDMMITTPLGGLGFIGAGLVLLACAWAVGRSRRVWREQAEEVG